LLRNLGDALVGVLATNHDVMAEAARAACPKPDTTLDAQPETAKVNTRAARAKQQSRERRLNRYQSVLDLMRKGMSQAAISRSLGIDRRTVRRWTHVRKNPKYPQIHRLKNPQS